MPTSDLLHNRKDKLNGQPKDQERDLALFEPIQDQSLAKASLFARHYDRFRSFLGIVPESGHYGSSGFRSIMKKSLHATNSRYRECLMEIAMLCDENSMNNFVDNLEDISILTSSMSPTIVRFFDHGFNETRFTKKIRSGHPFLTKMTPPS